MKKIILLFGLLFCINCYAGDENNAQHRFEFGRDAFSGGPARYSVLYGYSLTGGEERWNAEIDFADIMQNGQNGPDATKFIAISEIYQEHHLSAGLGLAYLTRKTDPYLSSKEEFFITIRDDLGGGWGISIHHLSNGGIRPPNDGENMIMITYRW